MHGHRRPEGRADGQEEPAGRDDGHDHRPEDEHEDDEREPDDHGQVGRQRPGEPLRDLDVGDGLPGEPGVAAGVAVQGRRREGDVVHGLDGGGIGRSGRGHDLEGEGVAVRTHPERHHAAHPVDVGQGRGDPGLLGEHVVVGARGVACGEGRDRDDGAVHARAELRRDRLVGRVGARAGRLAAAVGQPELDLGDRDGDHAEEGDDTEDGEPGPPRDEPDVPAAVLLLAPVVGHGAARHVTRDREAGRAPRPAGGDAVAHEAQHRGADGDGDEDGDGDRGGGDQTHLGEDRDAGEHQRGQRDDDRGAGEDDGAAGRRHRAGDRREQLLAVQEVAAVPVDDEQCVVDADGQPEHEGERRRRGVELGDRGEGHGRAEADPDPEQGDEEGQPGGDEAAEHHHEHEHGDGEPDDLPRTHDGGVLGDLDAVVRRDARSREGGGAPLRDQGPVRHGHGLGVLVELDLCDGIPPVLAHQAGALRRRVDRRTGGVLRAAGLQLGPPPLELGPAGLVLRAPLLELRPQAGDAGVVGVRRDELGEQALPAGELRLCLRELRGAPVQLALALVELCPRGGELRGRGVQLLLGLERVENGVDVRHVLPGGEDLVDGAPLLVGEGAVAALEHDGAEAAGRLGDLGAQSVEHPLEGAVRDGHAAAQGLSHGGGEDAHTGEHGEPERDDPPGVGGTPAGEAVQEGGHRALSVGSVVSGWSSGPGPSGGGRGRW